jgi:hypothetical protein
MWFFNSWFSKSRSFLEKGSCYAVLKGDYHGEIFVFFKQENELLFFVTLPKMEIRKVDTAKFEIGLKEKILDFINILPKNVFKVIESHGKNTLKCK